MDGPYRAGMNNIGRGAGLTSSRTKEKGGTWPPDLLVTPCSSNYPLDVTAAPSLTAVLLFDSSNYADAPLP
jgi:hypothetical protein